MHNYRRIVCAIVALCLFVFAQAALADGADCQEGVYKSYSGIDFDKCVILRPESDDPTNVLTPGGFTRLRTTCPVKIDHVDEDGVSNCIPVRDALNYGDLMTIKREKGINRLTLRRPVENKVRVIVDRQSLVPVTVKLKDGKARTVGYKTAEPVEIEVETRRPSGEVIKEIKTLDYYVYLTYAKQGKQQIKFYTIEAFDIHADALCQAERPSPGIPKVVDCEALADLSAYPENPPQSNAKTLPEGTDGQNRSGGGGEPMPNQ